MSFMDDAIEEVRDIWDACAAEEFLDEMADGSLDHDQFFDYIVQDSIYLRGYLKEFAFAIIKSSTLREMQMYYSLLGFVNDGENVTRLSYLGEHGMTDADVDKAEMRPQCRSYLEFLWENAVNGTQEDILMATLPCMMGYNHVFESLRSRAPRVMDGYFGPLVADYTSDGFRECCRLWRGVADEKCDGLDESRKSELRETFRQASLHELYFWQMAGEKNHETR